MVTSHALRHSAAVTARHCTARHTAPVAFDGPLQLVERGVRQQRLLLRPPVELIAGAGTHVTEGAGPEAQPEPADA